MMTEEEILSKNIRKYRESFKLTQGELAEMLNYSDKTISKWERGESIPDIFTIKKIAKIFRISIETLLTDNTTIDTKMPSPYTKGLWSKFTLQIIILSVLLAFTIAIITLCIITGPKLSYLYLFTLYIMASISLSIFIYIRCLKHRLNILTISLAVWSFYIGLILNIYPTCGPNILILLLLPILSQVFIVFYCNFRNKIRKVKLITNNANKKETI